MICRIFTLGRYLDSAGGPWYTLGESWLHMEHARKVHWRSGQALVEYMLMMVMLLFVFTGLWRVLTNTVRNKMFMPAGKAILRDY